MVVGLELTKLGKKLESRDRTCISNTGYAAAAVLILLFGKTGDYNILYTVRSNHVEHHKGEISFPGGGVDPTDKSLEETALRECFEEVGVRQRDVLVLGRLDDIITRSRFVVTPIVGVLKCSSYTFSPYLPEVAEVLEIPLSHLMNPVFQIREGTFDETPQRVFPSYQFGSHVIFGATALMTTRFLDLILDCS